MSKRYTIRIEDKKSPYVFFAEVNMAIIHIANKREDGVLRTKTFYTEMDVETAFRMYLSLGRAIQNGEFGHLNKDIGKIVEPSLFEVTKVSNYNEENNE